MARFPRFSKRVWIAAGAATLLCGVGAIAGVASVALDRSAPELVLAQGGPLLKIGFATPAPLTAPPPPPPAERLAVLAPPPVSLDGLDPDLRDSLNTRAVTESEAREKQAMAAQLAALDHADAPASALDAALDPGAGAPDSRAGEAPSGDAAPDTTPPPDRTE